MMRLPTIALVAALALLSLPVHARAEGFLTPSLGVAFGGDTVENELTYSIAIGFMAHGIIGMESDFGLTRDFFGDESNFHVKTMTVNFIVGLPIGSVDPEYGPGLRPYATVGIGSVTSPERDPDFGMDAGGGVMVFLGNVLGVRGDVRYFRNLRREEVFDFWRAMGGVIVRF